MKALFDTSSYYTGNGGASLVVEPSSATESEEEARRFRQALRADIMPLRGVLSIADGHSKWMQLEVTPLIGQDPNARAELIAGLIGVLRNSGVRFALLLLIDWLTFPYRDRHPSRARDELMRYGPDAARFERLQAMRLPSIEPWLDGREKVRDRASFEAFHGLDAASQALLRLAIRDKAVWPLDPCPDGCHPSWTAPVVAPLVADGWLVPVINQNPWVTRAGGYARGPRLGALNLAAGEAMGD